MYKIIQKVPTDTFPGTVMKLMGLILLTGRSRDSRFSRKSWREGRKRKHGAPRHARVSRPQRITRKCWLSRWVSWSLPLSLRFRDDKEKLKVMGILVFRFFFRKPWVTWRKR